MTTELNLDLGLERLRSATEDFLDASRVSGQLSTRKALYDAQMQLACERYGFPVNTTLSLEAHQDRSKSVLSRLREALIKAYQYLKSLIKEVIMGYQLRVNRLHDKLAALESIVQAMDSKGLLNVQARSFIDNLVLGNNLFVKERVTYKDVVDCLAYVPTWSRGVRKVWTEALASNASIASNAKALTSKADLRSAISQPPVNELQLSRASKQDALDVDTVFYRSRDLVKNAVITYKGTKPGANAIPYVETESGFTYEQTQAIDGTDRRLLRTPVLAGGEIKSLILLVRRNISEVRALIDTANAADYTLNTTVRHISGNEPLFESAPDRDAYYGYLDRSLRNTAKFVTESISRQFNLLFYSTEWINFSLTYYK